MGSLRPEDVAPLLRGRFGRPYRYVDSCPSTQHLLGPDDPEGAVAAADHQTAGRGRLGRVWEDAPGTGLLFSLLLRPDVPPERLPELTVAAAGAVAEALGGGAAVKEPNDVLLGGRKVAGILGEVRDGAVVLGVGINADQTPEQLPPETRLPATSLRIERGGRVDRAQLLAAVLERLETAYDAWVSAARAGR